MLSFRSGKEEDLRHNIKRINNINLQDLTNNIENNSIFNRQLPKYGEVFSSLIGQMSKGLWEAASPEHQGKGKDQPEHHHQKMEHCRELFSLFLSEEF